MTEQKNSFARTAGRRSAGQEEESGGNVARWSTSSVSRTRTRFLGATEDRSFASTYNIPVTFRNSRSLSGPLPKWIDLEFQRGEFLMGCISGDWRIAEGSAATRSRDLPGVGE